MNIVVVGCGKIGTAILSSLVAEGHDVVAIDSSSSALSLVTDIFDVMGVCGNGADCDTLSEAGIESTDIFVAVTGSDELNMLSCLIAKRMGAKHTVARIRNPEYNDRSLGFLKKQLELSISVNPELLAAQELFNILKFPSAVKIEPFAGRNFEMIELILKPGSPLDGMQLIELREKYKDDITIQIAAFAQEGVFQDDKTQGLLNDAMRKGADLVGGHTITFGEGERHIDFILDLAAKYGVEADFHLDESGNRENYLLPYLARRMKETGLCGRVNAIHMCTLSALNDAELSQALEIISGCALKATIAPTAISTRKIAPVKELLKLGIPVGLGSDNIRDFFNPMGSGDIKQIAYLLTYLQAFFTDEEVGDIWSMITERGAKVISADYGVREGGRADLTLFPTADVREIISYQLRPSHIIRSGSLIG